MTAEASLADKHALVVGVGARGQLAAAHLAAAGVGRIGLIDGAFFEERDLRTGPLTFTPDVGSSKADGAAVKLGLINDSVHAEPFPAFLDEANAELILQGADVVIDCTNDVDAHLIANDTCLKCGSALIVGDLDEAGGWWARPVVGHCLHSALKRSAADDEPEVSEEFTAAQLASPAIASAIASVQSAAAIALMTGEPAPSVSLLHRLDARSLNWSTRELSCSSDCVCRGGSTAGNV